jgi:hypothetical protein
VDQKVSELQSKSGGKFDFSKVNVEKSHFWQLYCQK